MPVAKRRNLKKEKAQRNQAYARQFRKQSSHSTSNQRRFNRGSGQGKDEDKLAEE
jgi:hypothetical protein